MLPPSLGNDGTVYFIASDNSVNRAHLFAISKSGIKLLEQEFEGAIGRPAVLSDEDSIYAVTIGQAPSLYAFSKDGTKQWAWQTAAQVLSPPAVAEDGTIILPVVNQPNQASTNGLLCICTRWNIQVAFSNTEVRWQLSSDWIGWHHIRGRLGTVLCSESRRKDALESALENGRAIMREDGSVLVSYTIHNFGSYVAAIQWDGIPDWITPATQTENFILGPGGLKKAFAV
jgi:hypothetical protein